MREANLLAPAMLTLGARCVVGAAAVVATDVAEGAIVAGNPTKVVQR